MPRGNSRGRRKRRRRSNLPAILILLLLIGCVAGGAVFGISRLVKGWKGRQEAKETEAVETTEPESKLDEKVMVDGIDITGMLKSEARTAIEKRHPWKMTVVFDESENGTYELPNLTEASINAVLDEVYSGEPRDNYTIKWKTDEGLLASSLEEMAARWNKDAVNAAISGYDKDSGQLTFAPEQQGTAIDTEKIGGEIRSAVEGLRLDAKIAAAWNPVAPELSEADARAQYKTIGSFKTNSTANSNRNNNLNLACKAVNGTILAPGQEFSFNLTTGNRTVEKGYKAAGAYQNGELVEEPGGGVCQVSSTLYNACVFAGIEVLERHAHTFEPSYVTPGEDAMVSYDGYAGPDLRFVNNTKSSIVIKTAYSDRTVTASIVGIPILQEGEKISMKSVKDESYNPDPPTPILETDLTLRPGSQVVVTAGDAGSRWITNIIHTLNGTEISNDRLHSSTYKGHTPKYRVNNTNTWQKDPNGPLLTLTAEEMAAIAAGETIAAESQAPVQETVAAGPGGGSTSAPAATTAASGPATGPGALGPGQPAPTTAAETTAAAPVSPAETSAVTPSPASPVSPAETSPVSPASPVQTTAAPAAPGSGSGTAETIPVFPGM